ncbi:aminopeptidase P family protein [Ponticoccus sp. SC2-23]|uniref:aminopeptidase P family protein n=1 Tax=Alexandriicola marinus TaxID=2081710 RepID=UPI000FD7BF0B|nr:aminopeptidase P family protein [Alexandriicola marinus]MBM1219470.1 aminopeptidase P family protein [Ponticoccus sp. SC6-9]MBM1223458.1 aminopeptidase P family protein [Ponticoccus sp. SC6-15]MBM1229283.1 aminopeptidase P family protein [Ponticoccus sp. SC6-38]MBM1232424.1 aminopeptidase P family protein [Ponticoccus sp. SC6-45]MBM1237626.1 aminopeptidase P family protein [Ponticoccus sp. SC6-49]MBM1241435.1 aminopeptidase P family protein [Ponticoccus sp. SC2-64]MBM1245948.1 aminopeptid
MFQTFEVATRPENGPPRLSALRQIMAEDGLDAYLVPRADAHQGEYVAPHDEVLGWLTGFTGSAGFCAVTARRAGVFIDGRYRVQVRAQVDTDHFTPVHWPETKLWDWLREALPSGGKVGFNPWLHTRAEIDKLEAELQGTGITMARHDGPFIDRIWPDRPAPPEEPVTAYPDDLAGEPQADKRARIGKALAEVGEDHAILTLPDSICWLLNLRGTDIPRNPVFQAFAILSADGSVRLYRRDGRAHKEIETLLGDGVTVLPEGMFDDDVRALSGKVRCDPKSAPHEIALALEASAATPVWGDDPCLLPKACKTKAELDGTRAAHLRDGAAMVNFLAWLDAEAPKGGVTEIGAVTALEGFRRATNALLDISFETIAGAGPNGAIVHYRVNEDSDRAVSPGELLLVDSGGQYLDGTTDITRTIAIGEPPADAVASYTAVLQGMIAISRARFPRGVGGAHLDALARFPLWTMGRDYDHGTGHGVGAYLSVHEGPQRISRLSDVALKEGMILSNEPGYYRVGAFGIRIENLLAVIPAPALDGADDRDMLAFETLTWVPLDRRLIDPAQLSPAERVWINEYHDATLRAIGPRVDGPAREWLEAACAPL